MKKLAISFALVLAANAQAQTSTTTISTGTNSSNAPAATSAASPTVTQTLTTKLPGSESRFGANLIWQSWVGVADLKENNSEAKVDSDNGVGITYKATDKLKTELRHRFAYRIVGDRDRLKNAKGQQEEPYKLLDPTVHANYNSEVRVLGSNPLAIANRFYVPVSDDSRDLNSLGTLRSQTTLDWDLTTRWSLSYMIQGRLFMYRDSEKIDDKGEKSGYGSDSVLYFLTGPSLTYNFSDKLNAYYFPYSLTEGTGFQRGDLRANKTNLLIQEMGLNIIVGAVTINPAYVTMASAQGTAGYEGMGSDANSEYDLNIIASF